MIHRRLRFPILVMFTASFVVATAAPSGARVATKASPKISAVVASFDPYAGADQRFIVGLLAKSNRTLAYGEVEFRFAYAGTKEQPLKQVTPGAPLPATYRPIPGSKTTEKPKRPRLVAPSKSRGVYGVDNARFDRPGLWAVVVAGKNGTRRFSTNAVFEVAAQPQVTAVGEPAPRSANPLPGAPGVVPTAVDSRAAKGTVPDAELHRISLVDAIGTGTPVMVVVSTPVYCVSQFCGPITDSIQQLARQYGDRMHFVHLEVWNDFENKEVNDAAGQWVFRRDSGDANEPWVFVVDGNGIVAERFDNVATDQDLQDAITGQGL